MRIFVNTNALPKECSLQKIFLPVPMYHINLYAKPQTPAYSPSQFERLMRLIIVLEFTAFLALLITSWAVLPDRDLDPLRRKTLTEWCALDYTRELLGRIDRKDLGEALSKYGSLARVDRGSIDAIGNRRRGTSSWGGKLGIYGSANVDEGKSKTGHWLGEKTEDGKEDKPEGTLSSDGEILKHKPDTNSILSIRQAKSTSSKTTNQIAGEHALWLLAVRLVSCLRELLLGLLALVLRL